MRLFWPEYRFQRAWQITPEWLARHGLTVLLLDVDNTLTTHDSPDIGPQARAWIAQMQQAGVRLLVLSNNKPARVEPFAEMIGLGCIANAKKPLGGGVRRALAVIETIVNDPEIGAIYKGRVTRLMNFGAFVELAPGKEGMVHISKLDMGRVEKVEDVVAVGDEVIVKVTDIDQQGRINLSRRDALIAMEAKKNAAKQ